MEKQTTFSLRNRIKTAFYNRVLLLYHGSNTVFLYNKLKDFTTFAGYTYTMQFIVLRKKNVFTMLYTTHHLDERIVPRS